MNHSSSIGNASSEVVCYESEILKRVQQCTYTYPEPKHTYRLLVLLDASENQIPVRYMCSNIISGTSFLRSPTDAKRTGSLVEITISRRICFDLFPVGYPAFKHIRHINMRTTSTYLWLSTSEIFTAICSSTQLSVAVPRTLELKKAPSISSYQTNSKIQKPESLCLGLVYTLTLH